MFQNILPVGLMNVIRSLNADSNTLKWNLETDGKIASVHLKWEIPGCGATVNCVNTVPMRRKTPSTIRRDSERKYNFLQYGSWRSPSTPANKNDTRTSKVSALSQTETFVKDDKITQTVNFIPLNSAVQTETLITVTESKSQQTSVPQSDASTNTEIYPDHPPTLSAAIQTDPEIETATVTQNSTSSVHVTSHVNMSACKNVSLDSFHTDLNDYKLNLKLKNETASAPAQPTCRVENTSQYQAKRSRNHGQVGNTERSHPIGSRGYKGRYNSPTKSWNPRHESQIANISGTSDSVFHYREDSLTISSHLNGPGDKIVDVLSCSCESGLPVYTVMIENGRLEKRAEYSELPEHIMKNKRGYVDPGDKNVILFK